MAPTLPHHHQPEIHTVLTAAMGLINASLSLSLRQHQRQHLRLSPLTMVSMESMGTMGLTRHLRRRRVIRMGAMRIMERIRSEMVGFEMVGLKLRRLVSGTES